MAYELEGFAAAAGLIYPGAAQALRGETGSQLPPAIIDQALSQVPAQ